MNLLYLAIFLFIGKATSKADYESKHVLGSLVFLSCVDGQKTNKDGSYIGQEFWSSILKYKPDALFWIGDSIYTKCSHPECIKRGYSIQNSNKEYQVIKKSGIYIDGTWDDHDYGINDGDKHFEYKETSQQLFLDFLSVPTNSPRRERRGVYSSHVFGSSPQKQVRIILLDTRYHRDSTFLKYRYGISSYSEYDYAITSMFAASLRFFCSYLGLGSSYEGDMLGYEQWKWLEEELSNSDSAINIIVSSIQVSNRYPFVESWGHYPKSRERLFKLLKKSKPRGLLFLSGDVHWAEIFGIKDKYGGAIEITSSGVTHSIKSDNLINHIFLWLTMPFYSNSVDKYKSRYTNKNFGKLDFNFTCEIMDNKEICSQAIIKITIHDTFGKPQLVNEVHVNYNDTSRLLHLNSIPSIISSKPTKILVARLVIILICFLFSLQTATLAFSIFHLLIRSFMKQVFRSKERLKTN
ncbi:uncharacterized protein CMU_033420 [Cryptosporidium muris RN66]|uniref:PhoD-like phosphatase metallophosphatase domain-containing protein n=1 Tax=Cryptosporidium muris (strain RN66) TaxID=441375 RepID=B6AFG6_CRYMR|nr:uncharacterized protein CMU_033420 [Cryptosporidium muris RN66]EEA06957.1 hypothetical protein, conserved [Cryptosporidium muris RN66]|eukprot:XP_002141306.1 hypothetical protein [Cryptosporidium muris RN66]